MAQALLVVPYESSGPVFPISGGGDRLMFDGSAGAGWMIVHGGAWNQPTCLVLVQALAATLQTLVSDPDVVLILARTNQGVLDEAVTLVQLQAFDNWLVAHGQTLPTAVRLQLAECTTRVEVAKVLLNAVYPRGWQAVVEMTIG